MTTAPPPLLALLARRAELTRALAGAVRARDPGAARAAVGELGALSAAVAAANQELSRQAVSAPLPSEVVTALGAEVQSGAEAELDVRRALSAAGAADLSSWFQALSVVEQLLGAPWDRKRDLVVVVGAGAFALGETLSARGQARVFCIDPQAPELAPRPQDMPAVVNMHALEPLEAACWWLSWPHPAQLRVHVAGPGSPLPVEAIIERFQRTLRALDQAGDEIEHSSYMFLHCALGNLPALARVPSVAPLAGCFAGMPAVVVSAGPSLDKNIHLLRELAGRAVIIGINQTVRALRKAGVRPDVVVALDPQNLSYQFEGVAPSEIGLLCLGASVGGQVFDVPAERQATFAASPMPEGWIYETMGEKAGLQSGGSVATAAIQVALHLGCSPVVMVGRDLALAGRSYYAKDTADGGQPLVVSDDGKTVSLAGMTSKLKLADGDGGRDVLRKRLEATTHELVDIPGFFGAPVTTVAGFLYEIDILRAIVHRERDRARFVNATEGGAFIEGMEHLPLRDVIASLDERRHDFRAAVAARLDGVDLAARRGRLEDGLTTMRADLLEAARLARRCADHPGEKSTRALDRLTRKHPILAVLTQRTLRDVQRRDRQGWESLDELAAAEKALYTSIANVADDLGKRLTTALTSLSLSAPPLPAKQGEGRGEGRLPSTAT